MPNRSVSFENGIYQWIESEEKRVGHNFSFIVNFHLKAAQEEKKKEKPQMLECPKHPGSSYSSRLSECPLCAEARTIADIEARDSMIVYERKRLADEIAVKQIEMTRLSNELNALDPETAEEGKRDKLIIEFDHTSDEMRQLKTKLSELV